MFATTQALYKELARALGVEAVPADEKGTVELDVGEDSRVVLFAEDESTLMLVSPVTSLPKEIDYGRALWLLRRNFYDSPIAPFRVSCDKAGAVVVWGRVPVEGVTGEQLAKLIDGLGAEADLIREEIDIDNSPAQEEATES